MVSCLLSVLDSWAHVDVEQIQFAASQTQYPDSFSFHVMNNADCMENEH